MSRLLAGLGLNLLGVPQGSFEVNTGTPVYGNILVSILPKISTAALKYSWVVTWSTHSGSQSNQSWVTTPGFQKPEITTFAQTSSKRMMMRIQGMLDSHAQVDFIQLSFLCTHTSFSGSSLLCLYSVGRFSRKLKTNFKDL